MTKNSHAEERGGGEKKKNYLLLTETKADTTHTVGAGRNITAKCHRPGGSSPLIFPPLLVFLLSFHFLPGASLVSSTVLHLFLFHPHTPPPTVSRCHSCHPSTPFCTLEVTIRFGLTFTELSATKTRRTLNKGRHWQTQRVRRPRHCRERE